jgi:hypothetical protein
MIKSSYFVSKVEENTTDKNLTASNGHARDRITNTNIIKYIKVTKETKALDLLISRLVALVSVMRFSPSFSISLRSFFVFHLFRVMTFRK